MLKPLVKELVISAWEELGFPPVEAEVAPSLRPEFGGLLHEPRPRGGEGRGDLAAALDRGWLSQVEVAGPGFVNVFLKPEAVHDALRRFLHEGRSGTGTKRARRAFRLSS